MKKCRWCGEEYEKLAKSHIIPKAFFNYDGKNDRMVVAQNEHKKRRPKGSYDTGILCEKCEADYSNIDNDAFNILVRDFPKNLIKFNSIVDKHAYQVSGEYNNKIKRFLIYTLWRASVSELDEFSRVKLGVYEDRIKKDIICDRVFSPHEYSFIAFRVGKPIGHIFPYREMKKNFNGCNYYTLDFCYYIINLKVDKRPTPKEYKDFALSDNVIIPKLEKVPDKRRKAMAKVVKESAKYMQQK